MYTQHSWCAAALTSIAGSAVALAAAPPQPTIIPTGVSHGSADISTSGASTVITASDGAIINYSQFDVPSGDAVRFIQPGADARVLNRIQSVDPSIINGSISANGIVYLVNPSGVVFGEGAVISAAGIVAAAANISDADFISGVDRFAATGGVVTNMGVINAESLVHLVGSRVENTGAIVAPNGVVSMTAGNTVYLADTGSRLMVQLENPTPPGDEPSISHTGSIEADTALFSTGDVYSIALGGQTDANTIAGRGGQVVLENAALDASGENAGGSITLAGALVFIDSDSTLNADARTAGAGGSITVVATEAAGVFGELSARGATASGGFVETSAANILRVSNAPDVSSPAGGGEWLIDPTDLDIVLDGLGTAGVVATPDGFASSAVGARIEAGTVIAGLLGGDVTLMTAAAGPEDGDINLLSNFDFDGVNGSTLTLLAHNDINIERTVFDGTFGDGDGLNLVLRADSDGSGAGGINQNRDLELGTGALTATGAFYHSAPTSEIIGASADINVAGDAVVPGRVFLTGALDVRAQDAVTFQPGAIIAGEIDSRSGLDGTGDTLFAAGDLQINTPVISFRAGIASTGSARVRIADNAPRLQGTAFGSRPSDFAIAQSASLISADLPALADFGNGTLTSLTGMDYTIETLGAGRDITLSSNSNLRGADLRVASAADLSVTGPLTTGALITSATGATNLNANVNATGGTYRGTTTDADLSGGSLATAGSLAADTIGLSFTGSAQLVTQGDAVIADPISGNSGAGGDLTIEAVSGDITQAPGATQPLDADNATFIADTITLDNLNATGDLRLVSSGSATVANATGINFGGSASTIGGDLDVTSTGAITDSSAVQVTGTSAFTATDSITLDQLDAAGTVFLDSALFASVTNARALDLGTSAVGGDLTARTLAGGITDNGTVVAGGSATFETLGAGEINLDTTTAPGGFTLITASGNASLAGADITLNNAAINGDFVVNTNALTLTGDSTATGSAEYTGAGTATGAGDQLISAGTTLTLNGQLLKTTTGDLTLTSVDLMTLGGNLDAADGSLRLNPAGRALVPDRATIAGLPDGMGTLKLSASDSVVIGRREKLTTLGSLTIEAGNQIITGDLNAFGDLTLTTNTLTLLSRDGARILERDGLGLSLTSNPDEAVDLIASGAIDVNASVITTDFDSAGDSDPLIANDGGSVTGTGGLARRQFASGLGISDFIFAGVVLDLAAPPTTNPVNPAGIAGDSALTDGGFELERNPQLDPALVAQLARMGIPVRAPQNAERITTVSGRGLYDDVSTLTGRAATSRLSGTVARSLVERYDALVGNDFSQAPAVQDRLGTLYNNFLAQASPTEATSGQALAAYMMNHGAAAELDAIAAIDNLLNNLGLTGAELITARTNVLSRCTPSGLDVVELCEIAGSANTRG